MRVILPVEVVNATIVYLSAHPYRDVVQLIDALRQQSVVLPEPPQTVAEGVNDRRRAPEEGSFPGNVAGSDEAAAAASPEDAAGVING
jgi:hypothetical protein